MLSIVRPSTTAEVTLTSAGLFAFNMIRRVLLSAVYAVANVLLGSGYAELDPKITSSLIAIAPPNSAAKYDRGAKQGVSFDSATSADMELQTNGDSQHSDFL
jgi:hypothetical protein